MRKLSTMKTCSKYWNKDELSIGKEDQYLIQVHENQIEVEQEVIEAHIRKWVTMMHIVAVNY